MARPIRDLEKARDKLADALWWLRGFSAAAQSGDDDIAHTLAEELSEVRAFLNEMQFGTVRRLGDEKAVILTYAEFERLVDASRADAHRDDLALAAQTIRAVLKQYGDEAHRARHDANPDIPF